MFNKFKNWLFKSSIERAFKEKYKKEEEEKQQEFKDLQEEAFTFLKSIGIRFEKREYPFMLKLIFVKDEQDRLYLIEKDINKLRKERFKDLCPDLDRKLLPKEIITKVEE